MSEQKIENPIGLKGIEFVYFTSLDSAYVDGVFKKLGLGSECGSCLTDATVLQKFSKANKEIKPKSREK